MNEIIGDNVLEHFYQIYLRSDALYKTERKVGRITLNCGVPKNGFMLDGERTVQGEVVFGNVENAVAFYRKKIFYSSFGDELASYIWMLRGEKCITRLELRKQNERKIEEIGDFDSAVKRQQTCELELSCYPWGSLISTPAVVYTIGMDGVFKFNRRESGERLEANFRGVDLVDKIIFVSSRQGLLVKNPLGNGDIESVAYPTAIESKKWIARLRDEKDLAITNRDLQLLKWPRFIQIRSHFRQPGQNVV